jgi:hypothetical protein
VNLDLVHRLGDGDGFIAIGIVDQNHQIHERLRHEFFADNAQRPCRIDFFLSETCHALRCQIVSVDGFKQSAFETEAGGEK